MLGAWTLNEQVGIFSSFWIGSIEFAPTEQGQAASGVGDSYQSLKPNITLEQNCLQWHSILQKVRPA